MNEIDYEKVLIDLVAKRDSFNTAIDAMRKFLGKKKLTKTQSAAESLGRIGGKKGGPARARKLSAKRRSQIARKAAKARWDKRK